MKSRLNLFSRLKNAIRNRGDESGSVTVEFVLWVPVFLIILALTVDVSLMFLRQSNMWQVARDTARQLSIRQFPSLTAAEDYAITKATFSGDVPTVVIDKQFIGTLEVIQVVIRVPISSVGVFGVLNIGGDNDLVAAVTQRVEPF